MKKNQKKYYLFIKNMVKRLWHVLVNPKKTGKLLR